MLCVPSYVWTAFIVTLLLIHYELKKRIFNNNSTLVQKYFILNVIIIFFIYTFGMVLLVYNELFSPLPP